MSCNKLSAVSELVELPHSSKPQEYSRAELTSDDNIMLRDNLSRLYSCGFDECGNSTNSEIADNLLQLIINAEERIR